MEYLDVDGLGPVSRIGLGTWQFGSREWGYGDAYADRAARDIVRRARELGITLFDTAEVYGFGRSERILGEALGHERGEVVVASKVFPLAPFPPVVRQRWAGSARRLGLTRIPLYQVHQPNPVVPDSVIMPGLRQPARRATGSVPRASPTTPWPAGRRPTPRSAGRSSATRCSSPSPTPHPWTTSCPSPSGRTGWSSPTARWPRGCSAAATRSPTGRAGCGRSTRCSAPRTCTASRRCSTSCGRWPSAHQARPAQVALAWLLGLPRVVVIPGASSVEQLEHNAAAAGIRLRADEQAALTSAARAFAPVSGARTAVDGVRERFGSWFSAARG